jgi:polysaccharide export outer membrane protein
MKFSTSFLVGFLALMCISCSGTKKEKMPPLSESLVTQGEYRIGVDDDLDINVWKNPELSLKVRVRPDGKISMPLIGDVPAADLTSSDLALVISKELTNFVKNPQVTVIVSNPSSSDFLRRVRVTGAVKNPQSIPYRDGMTVLDLVLLAGGLNDFASGNRATLFRKVNGVTKAYPVKLDDLINKGNVETNYALQPSDIVSVPERIF